LKTAEEIHRTVYKIIANIFDTSPEHLRSDQDLYDDLGADSLSELEILIECEEAFDIDLRAPQAAPIRALGDVAELVARLTRSRMVG